MMEQNAEDYFKQALAKFRSRDVKAGLVDLEEAIRLEPLRWEYYWTRGAFNHRRRAWTLALVDLTKAIELCADVKQAGKIYQRRMFCYGRLERYDSVVQDATWLTEHGFDGENVYWWRGWGNYKMGNIDSAADDYSRAIESSPDDYNFRMGRATIYYWSKRYAEALPDLTYLLTDVAFDPVIAASIHQFRSLTFYQLGNLEKSLEEYKYYQLMASLKPFSSVQEYVEEIESHLEHHFSGMPSRPHERFKLAKP